MPVQNGKQSGILESAARRRRQNVGACARLSVSRDRELITKRQRRMRKINHSAADKYFQRRCPRKAAEAIGHGYRPVIYHRLNGRNAPLLLERAVR